MQLHFLCFPSGVSAIEVSWPEKSSSTIGRGEATELCRIVDSIALLFSPHLLEKDEGYKFYQVPSLDMEKFSVEHRNNENGVEPETSTLQA